VFRPIADIKTGASPTGIKLDRLPSSSTDCGIKTKVAEHEMVLHCLGFLCERNGLGSWQERRDGRD
jgi:hypothetical protein